MPLYFSQSETADATEYAASVAKESGVYLPDELHGQAFDLVIKFGEVALSIYGIVEGEDTSQASDSEERARLSSLAGTSLDIGCLLMRKIPLLDLNGLNREYRKGMNGDSSKSTYLPGNVKDGRAEKPPNPKLSPTQIQMLELVSRGLTPEQISQHLSRAHTNVGTHLHNAYKKLGVHNAAAGVAKAFELGIFSLNPQCAALAGRISLTAQQKAVAGLAMEDLKDIEIGNKLGVSRVVVGNNFAKILEITGAATRAEAVRIILEIGGLDAIQEFDPKHAKNEIFLDSSIRQPEFRYGMYADWMIDICRVFRNRPLTTEDYAKLLYGEEFSQLTSQKLINRTNQHILHLLTSEYAINKLAEKGLKLAKLKVPDPGSLPRVGFMAIGYEQASLPGESDDSLRPSDDELKEAAMRLRQHEEQLQQQAHEWELYESQKKNETIAQSRLANQAIKEWYRHQELSFKVQLKKARGEVREWKASKEVHKRSINHERRVYLVDKIAEFCKAHVGEPFVYDDLLSLVTQSTDPTKLHAAKNQLSGAFTQNRIEPLLESDGLAMHSEHYKIGGKGRKRVVYLCLPKDHEPNWQIPETPAQPGAEQVPSYAQEVPEWLEEKPLVLREKEKIVPATEESKEIKSERTARFRHRQELDEDGFPVGFIEEIERLEEELRNPPPHDEILKILRARGWYDNQKPLPID